MNDRSCCTEYYLLSDKKQLATLNNIWVLLKDVLTDSCACNFVHAKTFLHTHGMHTRHCACNLLSPAVTFNKINRSPQVFLIYNKTNVAKLKYTTYYTPHIEIYHYIPHICVFCISVNFIIRFSGKEFFQYFSGHYSVKDHVWEKVYLLSYGSESYWPIRLHDFSESSISLTVWVFGMIFCLMMLENQVNIQILSYFLLVCPNLPRHTKQFFNEYLESCLTDVKFCLLGKYVMFNRWIILRSSRWAFFDFMNYSYFIIFDKDKLVFQFVDFILEFIHWKE